mmetsp:Transcript_26366/g.56544  ORF Transcript_26366/g.56544 Transcript_26366/m.56544 type:complete len:221 (-) Transcript_26366:1790-2452(-)
MSDHPCCVYIDNVFCAFEIHSLHPLVWDAPGCLPAQSCSTLGRGPFLNDHPEPRKCDHRQSRDPRHDSAGTIGTGKRGGVFYLLLTILVRRFGCSCCCNVEASAPAVRKARLAKGQGELARAIGDGTIESAQSKFVIEARARGCAGGHVSAVLAHDKGGAAIIVTSDLARHKVVASTLRPATAARKARLAIQRGFGAFFRKDLAVEGAYPAFMVEAFGPE